MLSLMLLCSIFGVMGALLVVDTPEDTEEAGKYLLISSSGPAADSHSGKVAAGLYHLSEEMREGRSVYIQEHDTKYGGRHPVRAPHLTSGSIINGIRNGVMTRS